MKPALYGLILLLPACGAASADQNRAWDNGGTESNDTFAYEAPPPEAALRNLAGPANDSPEDPATPGYNAVNSAWEVYRACVSRLADALWRTRGEPFEIVRRARGGCARQRAAYVTAFSAAARARGQANPQRFAEEAVGSDDERLDFELGTEIQQRRYPDSGM